MGHCVSAMKNHEPIIVIIFIFDYFRHHKPMSRVNVRGVQRRNPLNTFEGPIDAKSFSRIPNLLPECWFVHWIEWARRIAFFSVDHSNSPPRVQNIHTSLISFRCSMFVVRCFGFPQIFSNGARSAPREFVDETEWSISIPSSLP